jgi:hypothetical protein
VNDRNARPGREACDGKEATRRRADHRQLREAEVELARGKTAGKVCRKPGIPTIGGGGSTAGSASIRPALSRSPSGRNARLKKLVAEQKVDVAILRDAVKGNS